MNTLLSSSHKNNSKNLYLAVSPNAFEIEKVRHYKPPYVLLSFFYWKNKCIVRDFIDLIGYTPTIMLDSGGYSVGRSRKDDFSPYDFIEDEINTFEEFFQTEIEDFDNLSFHYYLNEIQAMYVNLNEAPPYFYQFSNYYSKYSEYISHVVSLDSIKEKSSDMNYISFQLLRELGVPAMPVFHYKDSVCDLDRYINEYDCKYVCLGGTANLKESEKVEWILSFINNYKDIKFHLLGTLNLRTLNKLPQIYSSDGTSWIARFSNSKSLNTDLKIEKLMSYS